MSCKYLVLVTQARERRGRDIDMKIDHLAVRPFYYHYYYYYYYGNMSAALCEWSGNVLIL